MEQTKSVKIIGENLEYSGVEQKMRHYLIINALKLNINFFAI